MTKFVEPLILVASISMVGAIVGKFVPVLTEWATAICPSGIVTPSTFLKLTNSCALLAIAIVAAEWLKAK